VGSGGINYVARCGTRRPVGWSFATLNPTNERPVLVIDDDPDDLALTVMLLRKVAHPSGLVTLTDGEAAVDFLTGVAPGSESFPLAIVLDVKMPGMSGLDLLEWVREHRVFDRVPVAMWSSSDDMRDVERAARLGAQCYLGKYPPVPAVEELFVAIRAWRGIGKGDRFFRVHGNLFLGRDALPDFRPVQTRDRPGQPDDGRAAKH
jgi:CheY-like chemotaxis protein